VHGVVSVVQYVEKNLLQLMSVAVDIGKSLVKVFDDVEPWLLKSYELS